MFNLRRLSYVFSMAALFALPAAADTSAAFAVPAFLEGLTISGEVRVMYDAVFADTTSGVSDRERGRFGFYLGARKKVNSRISAAVRLTTGTNVNPVFPYSSFTDASTGKAVVIDHAFLDLTPLAECASMPQALRDARIVAGKQPLPFRYIPSFVWDPDLSLEGISESVKFKAGRLSIGAVAGQFFLEDNAAADDPYLLSHTIAVDMIPNTPHSSRFGVVSGIYHFIRPYSIDATFQSLSNVPASQHTEPSGFSVIEAYGYGITFIRGRQIRLTGGLAKNLSAERITWSNEKADDGWMADLTIGQATAKRHTWELGGGYRVLEADAVLGQFTDFAATPAGATDAKSWFLHGAYVLWDNVSLASTFWSAEPESVRRFDHLKRIDVVLTAKF